MKRHVKWMIASAAVSVLCGTALIGRADSNDSPPSATQPTTKPDRRDRAWGLRDIGESRMQRGGGFMQARNAENYRNEELPTEDEWEEIVEFMKTNSPVRLEMYLKLESAGNAAQADRVIQGSRRRIAGKYRDLMAMKDRHADMYEFALRQTVLEDQVLGVLRDLRGSSENEALRQKLRELVTAYVDNFLNEREARLNRLKEMVERESQTISKDRSTIGKLIEKQSERFERDMSRLLEFTEDPDRFLQPPTTNP